MRNVESRQSKQIQWKEQWENFSDDELFLFEDWIWPNTLSDFEEKAVLECGCGGGQHTSFVAPHCSHIVAVDLNSLDSARRRNKNSENVEFVEDDIASMRLSDQYDVVFSIGVLHHTDDPDKSFENIKRHAKPGGRVIVWVYSREGNWIVRNVVEPTRKVLLSGLSRRTLTLISYVCTAMLCIPVYTIYRLPLRFLPYFDYFGNFRKMSFERNLLNVFDKLNAPQVEFISRDRISRWFHSTDFKDVYIDHYKGVSWRASGTRV